MDAAIVDGTAHLNSMATGLLAGGLLREERAANLLDGGAPYYDLYETADGKHLAVGALEPQFYDALVAGLGIADSAPDRNDPANHPELRRLIAERVRARTQAEWVEVFDGTDACVAPVLPMTEAFDHPHLVARGDVRGARRRHPAGPCAPLLAHRALADHATAGEPRAGHPRGPERVGDRRRRPAPGVGSGRPGLTLPDERAHAAGVPRVRECGTTRQARRRHERGVTMGLDDKIQNEATEAKGKVKEAAGSATDDESLEAEGKADQGEAKVKKAGEHVKDAADNVKDIFKS